MFENIIIDEIKWKTPPQIAYVIYHNPLNNLLNRIINDDINGDKFIKLYRQKSKIIKDKMDGIISDLHVDELNKVNLIQEETGWTDTEIYQIESILFRHLSMTEDQFITNMNDIMEKNLVISKDMKQTIRDNILKFRVEKIYFCMKNGQEIEEFSNSNFTQIHNGIMGGGNSIGIPEVIYIKKTTGQISDTEQLGFDKVLIQKQYDFQAGATTLDDKIRFSVHVHWGLYVQKRFQVDVHCDFHGQNRF